MSRVRKLIRDQLYKPERGDSHVIPGSGEHKALLLAKLHEELAELAQTDFQDYGEYADVLEVLRGIAFIHNKDWEACLDRMQIKFEGRGGFAGGVVMDVDK